MSKAITRIIYDAFYANKVSVSIMYVSKLKKYALKLKVMNFAKPISLIRSLGLKYYINFTAFEDHNVILLDKDNIELLAAYLHINPKF